MAFDDKTPYVFAMTKAHKNLIGLDREELAQEMDAIGEKPFRTKQLWHWIYHQGETDFSKMTTLAKPARATLAEHYIIADQCIAGGMKLVSLAPRFIGDFEKGVDYKGDVDALEASLNDHAAIARRLGPYKLSLHSGSDVSILPPSLC